MVTLISYKIVLHQVVTIVQLQWHNVIGANILMAHQAPNLYIVSHVRFQVVLSKELVRRGNRVVTLSNSFLYDLVSKSHVTEIFEFSRQLFYCQHQWCDKSKPKNKNKSHKLLERLAQEKFDLMLINPFGQCEYCLLIHATLMYLLWFSPSAMQHPAFNEDI